MDFAENGTDGQDSHPAVLRSRNSSQTVSEFVSESQISPRRFHSASRHPEQDNGSVIEASIRSNENFEQNLQQTLEISNQLREKVQRLLCSGVGIQDCAFRSLETAKELRKNNMLPSVKMMRQELKERGNWLGIWTPPPSCMSKKQILKWLENHPRNDPEQIASIQRRIRLLRQWPPHLQELLHDEILDDTTDWGGMTESLTNTEDQPSFDGDGTHFVDQTSELDHDLSRIQELNDRRFPCEEVLRFHRDRLEEASTALEVAEIREHCRALEQRIRETRKAPQDEDANLRNINMEIEGSLMQETTDIIMTEDLMSSGSVSVHTGVLSKTTDFFIVSSMEAFSVATFTITTRETDIFSLTTVPNGNPKEEHSFGQLTMARNMKTLEGDVDDYPREIRIPNSTGLFHQDLMMNTKTASSPRHLSLSEHLDDGINEFDESVEGLNSDLSSLSIQREHRVHYAKHHTEHDRFEDEVSFFDISQEFGSLSSIDDSTLVALQRNAEADTVVTTSKATQGFPSDTKQNANKNVQRFRSRGRKRMQKPPPSEDTETYYHRQEDSNRQKILVALAIGTKFELEEAFCAHFDLVLTKRELHTELYRRWYALDLRSHRPRPLLPNRNMAKHSMLRQLRNHPIENEACLQFLQSETSKLRETLRNQGVGE